MRCFVIAPWILAGLLCAPGCHLQHGDHGATLPKHLPHPPPDVPRELAKVVLPTYTVEPPDILVIEAIHIVPRSPYSLRTADVLAITVQGTLPDAPVVGAYSVQPGGIVNLGAPYGTARVAGLTIEQAREEVRRVMAMQVKDPVVSVSLIEMAGKQQIAGEHLVGPDGTVTLGSYGSVPVVGLTLAETKRAIELHLSQSLEDPEVAVDVYAYNSKVYYVITEGAGLGDGVTKFPITGNETVLDAIANINGLTEVSSMRIWIARPSPCEEGLQILPVDWQCVAAYGGADTNYQLMPGDRVFVAEDRLIAFDTHLAKVLAPLERAMGFTLLSTGTATRLSGKVLKGGGNPSGTGGGP
jgi:polysaccharide biosynthesis/export protein